MRKGFLLAGVTASVVLAGIVIVWFTTFSGLNQPAQFVYGGF
ncbi:MAG: hypothetical protein Q4B45_07935 [Coriobacteriia bacterium]|nr:hypothetical protein [Coriobacteriia bacterium]